MGEDSYLCSHLLRVWTTGKAGPPEVAVLEQISESGAVISGGPAYDIGSALLLDAGEITALAAVISSIKRKGDYATEVRFSDGYRWSAKDWKPDHLCRLPGESGREKPRAGVPKPPPAGNDEPLD